MKHAKIFVLAVIFTLGFFLFSSFKVKADNCDANCQLQKIQQQISEYQSRLDSLRVQSNTLFNQIAQFDAQIKLAELKIQETQSQITLLEGRIDQLQGSLDSLSNAYDARVVESYKMDRVGEPLLILITANNLHEGVSRFFYLQKLQEADHNLLVKLSNAQNSYKKDKSDMEDLKKNLQSQKDNLNSQKAAKANLLVVTKNDETKYQQLLQSALAEFNAIQSIISGKGEETQVGHVNEGDKIASIIPNSSPCSTGAHLHFEVRKDSSLQDPNDYLRQISFTYSYNSDQYSYYGTINPHGNWNWPLNEPIIIHQGYGSHGYAIGFYPGGIHTGIDMGNFNQDLIVKAVKNGTLYRGGIACGGGNLQYVRVHHDEGGLDTFYLHVNY